jgi:hypothetical protein
MFAFFDMIFSIRVKAVTLFHWAKSKDALQCFVLLIFTIKRSSQACPKFYRWQIKIFLSKILLGPRIDRLTARFINLLLLRSSIAQILRHFQYFHSLNRLQGPSYCPSTSFSRLRPQLQSNSVD